MAAAPVNLDQGPPLPPNLQPAPQASAQQLAGGQAQPSGSASLQQQVIQKAMFIEQALNDIATMMPSAAGFINSSIDQFRKGLGGLLARGASPPPAQGPMGGGMMMSGGSVGIAPTS